MTGRRRRTPNTTILQILSLALVLMLPSLTGCGLLGQRQERKVPHPGVIDVTQPRELNKVTLPPYVVEPPDDLEIAVRPITYDVSPNIVTVQPEGTIDLGFDGDVYVAGLTLREVEAKIAHQLTHLAIQRGDPPKEPIEVAVRLANETQSKYYYVIGTVTSQGSFPLRGGETVLQAILLAGLRSNSLPEKAYLVRPSPPGHPFQILKIDWEGIKERGDTTTNYQIFPGDRIVVPGTRPPGLLSTLFGT
jgi:polysaccharide export outer membrane protein